MYINTKIDMQQMPREITGHLSNDPGAQAQDGFGQ
jgi:hypothetical protein